MKRLSNNELTDVELRNWCNRYINGFVDVINRSEFPDVFEGLKSGESVIINLDPNYENGGTHWVALRMSSEAPLVFYKDSFGAPCPTEIIDSVKKSGLGLIYGNKITQKISQSNCGKRSAEFLYNMDKASKNGVEIEYFDKLENS